MSGQQKYDPREVLMVVLRILKKKKFMVYWDLQKATGMCKASCFHHMNKLMKNTDLIKKIKIRTSNKPQGYFVIFVLRKNYNAL